MRNILIYILTVLPLFTYGQKSNTILSTGSNDVLDWTYSDFLKSGVTKVEAYSYEIKKNGKINKSDSTMLFRKQIDLDSNKVFGINCNLNYQSHGPAFYSWYKFRDYYNQKGNLIMQIDQPLEIVKTKEFGSTNWEISINKTTFQFDDRDLLTKKVYNRIEHSYSVSKYTKDTFHLHTEHPKIYEFEYNDQGKGIKNYYTDDSTRYLATESYTPDTSSVECFSCDPRYLNGEKEYDSNGNLIKWVWYTRKNEIHSKKYYFYIERNQLTKQIDSTGWYFTTIEPYWESTITYEYTDSIKIKTQINNTEARFGSSIPKTVTTFDKYDRVIESCTYSDSTESCTNYSYRISDGHLIEIKMKFPDGRQSIEKYTFNDNGLLTQESHFLEDRLTRLIRYYYE